MFIHIGNRHIVSEKKTIGIFNSETLKMSDENKWIINRINVSDRSVAIDENNNITSSKVSPFTVIKRTSLDKDFTWRRLND